MLGKYRNQLPQLRGKLFLTDGGIETTLVFLEGFELPYFAAFDLMKDQRGKDALRKYFERYIQIARAGGTGFILESPTWRANADWGDKLGYSAAGLAEVNRDAVKLMKLLRNAHENAQTPIVISGCIGPRGDGYDPGTVMSSSEAEVYHAEQIRAFDTAGVDMVAAMTMTNVNEAIGIAAATRSAAIPAVISFTVETNGRLPTGESLQSAIEYVDDATGNAPVYYMINCAHPTHFADAFAKGGAWIKRIRGLRANASTRSHAELNDSPTLDAGDPLDLALEYSALVRQHKQLNVLGGCCGTDHRHIQCITDVVTQMSGRRRHRREMPQR